MVEYFSKYWKKFNLKNFPYIEIFLFLFALSNNMFMPMYKTVIFNFVCNVELNSTLDSCKNNVTINSLVQESSSKHNFNQGLMSFFPNLITPFVFGYIASLGKFSVNILLVFPTIVLMTQVAVPLLFTLNLTDNILYMTSFEGFFPIFGNFGTFKFLIVLYIYLSNSETNLILRFLIVEALMVGSEMIGSLYVSALIEYTKIYIAVIQIEFFLVTALSLLFMAKKLKTEQKQKESHIKTNSNFKVIFDDICGTFSENKYISITLIFASACISFAEFGVYEIIVNFCLLKKFNFTYILIGTLIMISAGAKCLGSGILLPIIIKFDLIHQKFLCIACTVISTTYYVFTANAKNRTEILIAPIFLVFEGVLAAVSSHLITSSFGGNHGSIILGFLNSASNFGISVGIITSNYLFKATFKTYPGAVFLLNGFFMFTAGTLVSIVSLIQSRKPKKPDEECYPLEE